MNWIVIMVGAGLGVCLAGMVGEWLAWRRENRAKQQTTSQAALPIHPTTKPAKPPTLQWCILLPVHTPEQIARVLTNLQLCHLLVGWPKPHLTCLVVDDSL